MENANSRSSHFQAGESGARVNGLDLMDPATDQALDYLGQFDRSNDLVIHLNRAQSSIRIQF